MSFYKCTAVYGPQKVECITISGCPTATANGDYLPTEFTTDDMYGNKHTVYFNGTYYYFYEPYDWGAWMIASDYTNGGSTRLYFGQVGQNNNWSDADWNTVDGMKRCSKYCYN